MTKTLPKRPLHQNARRKGLTQRDINELEKFKTFLRMKGHPMEKYRKVYGQTEEQE